MKARCELDSIGSLRNEYPAPELRLEHRGWLMLQMFMLAVYKRLEFIVHDSSSR